MARFSTKPAHLPEARSTVIEADRVEVLDGRFTFFEGDSVVASLVNINFYKIREGAIPGIDDQA